MNDRDLVQRCLSGDGDAWSAFLQAHTPLLRALARTTLAALGARAGEAEIDDVCSAVLEALVARDFRVLRSFRWQCSIETWLRVLVRTACVRALRRKSVNRQDLPSPEPAGQPLDLLLVDEARDAVREEVDSLPARERRVLTMFLIDGKSYREIADAFRIPLGTVATLLARTRTALRDRLQARGLGEEA